MEVRMNALSHYSGNGKILCSLCIRLGYRILSPLPWAKAEAPRARSHGPWAKAQAPWPKAMGHGQKPWAMARGPQVAAHLARRTTQKADSAGRLARGD